MHDANIYFDHVVKYHLLKSSGVARIVSSGGKTGWGWAKKGDKE